MQNKIKIDNSGTTRDITGVQSYASQTLGIIVSKYGCTTGYTYGQLTSKTLVPDSVPNAASTWMEVTSLYGEVLAAAGDSRGPWYSSYKAYGIQQGAIDNRACYMSAD